MEDNWRIQEGKEWKVRQNDGCRREEGRRYNRGRR